MLLKESRIAAAGGVHLGSFQAVKYDHRGGGSDFAILEHCRDSPGSLNKLPWASFLPGSVTWEQFVSL